MLFPEAQGPLCKQTLLSVSDKLGQEVIVPGRRKEKTGPRLWFYRASREKGSTIVHSVHGERKKRLLQI